MAANFRNEVFVERLVANVTHRGIHVMAGWDLPYEVNTGSLAFPSAPSKRNQNSASSVRDPVLPQCVMKLSLGLISFRHSSTSIWSFLLGLAGQNMYSLINFFLCHVASAGCLKICTLRWEPGYEHFPASNTEVWINFRSPRLRLLEEWVRNSVCDGCSFILMGWCFAVEDSWLALARV